MHVDAAGSVLGDVPVFDDGPFPSSAISETDAHILLIKKSDIRELCIKYPSLALTALKLMAAKVRRHASLVEALSLHEVGQRLALFLLAEARSATLDSDVPKPFRLRLSNQEIAGRIGSVRDVVSRALTRLKHEKLISLDKRKVTILNLQALKRYAARGSTLAPRTLSDCHTDLESMVLSSNSGSRSGLH
jgi:CRP/FNR family transcriptional regulator